MVIDNERAVKILTSIQKYCKDKSWCLGCPLGRDECNALFGEGAIPSGWEINLKAPENNTEKEVTIVSSVNKFKELAGIFGKEIGEEFNVIDNDGKYLKYNPYHFTDDCLVDRDGDCENSLIMELINGDYTIEKAPFAPKDGEEYYTYYFSGNDSPFNGRILTNRWKGSPIDKMNKLLGIVFRTKKEAKDYLPTFEIRLEGEIELD